MRIAVLEDGEVLRDLNFDEGPITIGSDSGAHVHLPDLGVHLAHARLAVVPGGQWTLESMAPTAQTTINGRELDKRCPVYNGDEVTIGGFSLKLAVDGQFELGTTGKTSLDELARIRDFPLPRHGEAKQYDEPVEVQARVHRSLGHLGQEVAGCQNADVLIDYTLNHMLKTFDARMAWFGVRRQPRGTLEFMEGRSSDGGPGHDPPLLPTLEYRCLDRGQSIRLRRMEDGASAIATPLQGRRGRFGLLYLESRKSAERLRGHHLDLLFLISTHVAARLEAILLASAPSARAELEEGGGGLASVRAVQRRLAPRSVPPWPGFQVGVYFRPGLQNGGDLYDCLTMPNGLAALFIGCAEGDEATVATNLAQAQATFRVAGLHGDPPHTVLRELNWLLHTGNPDRGLSAAQVVLNPKSGAMEVAAAGAIGAMVITAEGESRVLADSAVPRLGSTKSMEFPRCKERLLPGQMLALFTPGWNTIQNEEGEVLGRQRFTDALCDGFGVAPADLLLELQRDLARFFKSGRQPDDITVMLVQRT